MAYLCSLSSQAYSLRKYVPEWYFLLALNKLSPTNALNNISYFSVLYKIILHAAFSTGT